MADGNREVLSSLAPPAVGAYSQAVVSSGAKTIYVSGQLPIDAKTGEFVAGGISQLTNVVIDYIEAILKEAGATLGDVVRVDVFLTDINNIAAMNAVYEKRFSKKPYPARQTVQVAALPRGSMIEMSCIAQIY